MRRIGRRWGGSAHSGPYLHDGRAKTLDEMVMWPGGRRTESDRRFQALTEVERLQVQAFLEDTSRAGLG